MNNYNINKGIGRTVEFKGLKAQYLFIFAGGLLGTLLARGLGIAGRRRLRRLAECRNRVLDGTQRPAFGLLIVGQRGQAQGDAEG